MFIIASSEYAIRKPNRILFEIALKKAELPAEQVWYCGDSIASDVMGAHGAGIYPVLYDGDTPDEANLFSNRNEGIEVDFDYLHIHDWLEMVEILERL